MSDIRPKAAAAAITLLLIAGVVYISFYGGGGPRSTNSTTSPTKASTTSSATSSTSSESSTVPDLGNWTTYHKDNTRSGDDRLGSVSTATPGWVYPSLDGHAYAEPLVLGSTVFVATENDSVYAINAYAGTLVWRTHLGSPVPGGSLPCGDINPSGITGTPVIDVATRTLYAVSFLDPAHHVLFGLSIDDGTVKSQVAIDPPGADPTVEQQRGALALSGGVVYVPYGGLEGDCGAYHGWVVGAFVNGSSGLLSYQVPTNREGGIWAPSGVTVGANGDVYVTTGNGDSTTTFDHGDSVIRLSPSLHPLDYYAPSNWAQLNSADIDLGSVAPTILPGGAVFQAGKEGVGYLLSGNALGGIGGEVYSAEVCSAAFGGTAHVGQAVFLPCTDGVVEVKVGVSNFTVGWRTSSFFAGSPILTGDVVWAVDVDSGKLMGYDLATGAMRFSFTLGSAVHFETPSAGDGRLFVAAGDQLRSYVLG